MADSEILIVYNDYASCRILFEVLKARGHTSRMATTNQAALDKTRACSPATILINVQASRPQDLDMIQQIKTYSPDSNLITLLQHTAQQTIPSRLEPFIYATIEKPVHIEQLLDVVESNLHTTPPKP